MLFHIPHASKFIPNRERTAIVLDNIQLSAELILMTDAYTDELFGSHAIDQDSILNYSVFYGGGGRNHFIAVQIRNRHW
jgi:hypothetical protein